VVQNLFQMVIFGGLELLQTLIEDSI